MSQFGGVLVESKGSQFGGVPTTNGGIDPSTGRTVANVYKDDAKLAAPAGRGRTILDQGLQAPTFGLGDEITDYIGSQMAQAYGAVPYISGAITGNKNDQELGKDLLTNDLYSTARDQSKERMASELEQRPVLSAASNIGGALTGGVIGTSTKAGAALANSLRSGEILGANLGFAGRALKGAAYGAPVGAITGFNTGRDGEEERLRQAKKLATSGGAVGLAIPLLSSAVGGTLKGTKNAIKGVGARNAEELAQDVTNSKGAAVAIKNGAGLDQFNLNDSEMGGLVSNMDTALSGVKLLPGFTPKTIDVIEDIRKSAANKSLTLNDIDQYRSMLSEARGRDAVAASQVRRALDQTVDGLSPQGRSPDTVDMLNEFRKSYSQASRFGDIAEIATKAAGDPNKIRRQLTKYVETTDNLRGWTDEEKLALKTAAKSSKPQLALKALGTFGFDVGQTGKNVALAGLTAGGQIFAPGVGVPLATAGTLARQVDKYVARGKLETLLQILENGGKITNSQVGQLPPKDAMYLLQKIGQKKINVPKISIQSTP